MSESVAGAGERLVVVGVDGSAESAAALRWAVHYARALDRTIVAVIAWHHPVNYGYPPVVDVDAATAAATVLAETVDAVVGAGTRVRVLSRVRQGHPATVLLEASRDADLLVVGNRGHGAFTGMVIGSVSAHCAHSATCPVVIVPHRAGRPG